MCFPGGVHLFVAFALDFDAALDGVTLEFAGVFDFDGTAAEFSGDDEVDLVVFETGLGDGGFARLVVDGAGECFAFELELELGVDRFALGALRMESPCACRVSSETQEGAGAEDEGVFEKCDFDHV